MTNLLDRAYDVAKRLGKVVSRKDRPQKAASTQEPHAIDPSWTEIDRATYAFDLFVKMEGGGSLAQSVNRCVSMQKERAVRSKYCSRIDNGWHKWYLALEEAVFDGDPAWLKKLFAEQGWNYQPENMLAAAMTGGEKRDEETAS